jgi:nucleoside-diphosphate-sugar epimerase
MAWGRLFNPFGPNEDPRRLIPKTCLRLLKGEKIQFDAGLSLRDFLHVDEVGSAITSLLLSGVDGPVNIASGKPVAIRELVSDIATYLNCPDCITFAAPDINKNTQDMVVADITRLEQECTFQPKKSFKIRLQETCNWWAQNNKLN